MTPQEIISDARIREVHANANFGSQTPREVVNSGVLKYAFGYEGGSTMFAILREHKLIHTPSKPTTRSTLTAKGRAYLRAVYQFTAVRRAEDYKAALSQMVDAFDEHVDIPDRNCSCHLAPPCSDCETWSFAREARETARELLKSGGSL
jgi:hypothetical protein